MQYAYCYYIEPQKSAQSPAGCEKVIVQSGTKLFSMLSEVYQQSDVECKIPISFVPSVGQQDNDVRRVVLNAISAGTLDGWLPLANKLSSCTNSVAGRALFFVMHSSSPGYKTVFARFPADSGIMADVGPTGLKVELIEKVFMRNSRSYKSVKFMDTDIIGGYWDGYMVDRQIHSDVIASNYWVCDFLSCNYKTTPAMGSRRIGEAIKAVTQGAYAASVKGEIMGLADMLKNFSGHALSATGICTRFNLSQEARKAFLENIKPPKVRDEIFMFEHASYMAVASLRMITLDNGVKISAPTSAFHDAVTVEPDELNKVKVSSIGNKVADVIRGDSR